MYATFIFIACLPLPFVINSKTLLIIFIRQNLFSSFLKFSGRRHSPSPNRLTPEPFVEKDEGISEEEDPAELRLLLELNEQETGVLRRKVEELETDLDVKKQKLKEAEEKLSQVKTNKKPLGKLTDSAASPLDKEKIKIIEEECGELRKKLIEKERENERLQNEASLKKKGTLIKSK